MSGLCQPSYVLDIPGGYGKSPVGPCYLHVNADAGDQIEDFNGRKMRLPGGMVAERVRRSSSGNGW